MSSCRFCTHFQRVNFKLHDKHINNVEDSNTVTTTEHYYEASYFPVSDTNEAVAWGVCKKTWKSVKADFIKCDTFECAATSSLLEESLDNLSNTKRMFNPSTQGITTNIGLFNYYINNLCAKSISELKSQKHCVFCIHWAETYDHNIDIPPAYIPYFESQDRCLINTASRGICCITHNETHSIDLCNCDSTTYHQDIIPCIKNYTRRIIEAKRKMRTLMRLEAIYIINAFPNDYEKGTDNGYHMRMFNSYNITNTIDKSNKFLNITPSMFRGQIESTYDTIKDQVTDPNSMKTCFNYTVVQEYAQYYHVAENYLLGYTNTKAMYDPDFLEFILGHNNTLYDILNIIKHILPTKSTNLPNNVILTLDKQPSLISFFKPSLEDSDTLEYAQNLCKTDIISKYKWLNRSFIYAVYLLLKSNNEHLIMNYIESNKYNPDDMAKLLLKPTDETALIKRLAINSITPTEEYLVELLALMYTIPNEILTQEAKSYFNKLVDTDRRNRSKKTNTKQSPPNSIDERIRSRMAELDITKKLLCQTAVINPKTYEAAMTEYINHKNGKTDLPNQSCGEIETEVKLGFDFKELHKIASALDRSMCYFQTGNSDYYIKSEYGKTKIVRNPFVSITDKQAKILNDKYEFDKLLYTCNILSSLFRNNRFFTTVAVEYYRRAQPQKVIEFIRHMKAKVPANNQLLLQRLRQDQYLDDLFKKNT